MMLPEFCFVMSRWRRIGLPFANTFARAVTISHSPFGGFLEIAPMIASAGAPDDFGIFDRLRTTCFLLMNTVGAMSTESSRFAVFTNIVGVPAGGGGTS